MTVGQGVLGSLLALVGAALPFLARRVEQVGPAAAWTLGGLLAATGLATLVLAVRGRALMAALTPAAGLALVYLLVVTVVYPAFEPVKSARPLAQSVARVTAASRAAGVPVLAYDIDNVPEALAYYSNGLYTVETSDPHALVRHLQRPEPAFALADAADLEAVPDGIRRQWVVVEETLLARQTILLLGNGRDRRSPERDRSPAPPTD